MSDKIQMFGRSYNSIGDSSSDIILKTKGQIKIQWGSKYIDLIKDGKISTNSSFIFKVDDYSKIGSKNGIYIVNDSIYLKFDDSIISLLGESNTYVSFLGEQKTTSNDKYTALINIGFLYKSLDDLDETSLQNGIIYIESEQSLYIVKDGVLTKFSFPNTINSQFILQKSDSTLGALVIKGSGKENSILFDSMSIYDQNINITNTLNIKVNDEDRITINNQSLSSNIDIICDVIRSKETRINKGFKLYNLNGESTLEIDNLIVRNSSSSSTEESNTKVYPEYWLLNTNVIQSIDSNTTNYDIKLQYKNTYNIDDILYAFDNENNKYTLTVISISDSSINVSSDKELSDSLINNLIFLVQTSDEIPIRINNNNIDIIDNDNIKTRIGNLITINQNGFGIYTDNLIIGGNSENYLPRYTNETNNLLNNLESPNDCILVSVSLLNKIIDNKVSELNTKISNLETEIENIKKQISE